MQSPYNQQGYPYFNQPINQYPPNIGYAGPSNPQAGYAPYHSIRPQGTPYPGYNDLPMPTTNGGQTSRMPRPKHLQPSAMPIPRKSAMKKPEMSNGIPLTRQRTNSNPGQPLSRHRSSSTSKYTFTPYHIYVTFRGTNELLVENITYPDALNELRQELFPLWPPGVLSNESKRNVWRVLFSKDPWSSSGRDALMAWEIITRLFGLLAKRGYSYIASVNTVNHPPRLVFVMAQPDMNADFFLAHFSSSGHRVTLINPPTMISESIGPNLKAVLPRKIASDRISEDNVVTVEVKRNGQGGLEVEKNLFETHVLKEIAMMGYGLHTTIPMARRGLFGLGSRKEIWVFKGGKGVY